ncbi:MAG: DUF366 family protein [Planctomycetota bacterium]|nr:DUF366 family protein [Planctomycetota bacterium]
MNIPQTLFIEKPILYTGAQLSPHWIFKQTCIKGDSIVAFIGGCKIEPEHMADVEDKYLNKRIEADSMLHFLCEHFGVTLNEVSVLQRLLVFLTIEALLTRRVKDVSRDGDDIFIRDGKLSISVATVSPVSGLIHLGLNITNEGTPVKTASLSDIKIEPKEFALDLLERYRKECASILDSSVRVAPKI